jgi:hypothetical protein
MIALAGLYAMLKFKPCRTKLTERRYIEAAKDDIDHAHNCALGIALARLENKVPHGTDALTEEHHRAAAKEHERICAETERLIAQRWDAICRVAAELRKQRFLLQDDVDSLINPQRWNSTHRSNAGASTAEAIREGSGEPFYNVTRRELGVKAWKEKKSDGDGIWNCRQPHASAKKASKLKSKGCLDPRSFSNCGCIPQA